MDFQKTEEQELLLESLREVYARADLDNYFKDCDQNHEFPEKAIQIMVDNGFHMLGIPEEYGGTEVSLLTQCIVLEEAVRLGFPGLVWPNYSLEVDDMLAFGNKEQQARIIELAKVGKKPFTLGFTEPQAGSDNSAITATATRKNGKVYINGHKTFNSYATISPYMLCMVRDFKNDVATKDMSMWFVPLDAPGVTIKPINKIGNNMFHSCEVYLDNVEIEEKDLVGLEGKGFYQLMKNFEIERLLSTVHCLGMAQCAYEESVRYANQRVQFGKPIGSFQLIQEKVAYMAIKIENMRNMVYKCAWQKDNDQSISISSALTKLYTAQAAFEVIDQAMQIMGGIGYTHDARVSRLWKDQRLYRIIAGTDEIMIHIAGRALVKQMAK